MQASDQQLYHPSCHKRRFHPTCAVCNEYLPKQVSAATTAASQHAVLRLVPEPLPVLLADSAPAMVLHALCALTDQRTCAVQGDAIHWVSWALQDKCCPAHSTDGTARCCGCGRLCPRAESWPEVEQGRNLCLACLDSVVVDTQDAQPLYSKVSGTVASTLVHSDLSRTPQPSASGTYLQQMRCLGNPHRKFAAGREQLLAASPALLTETCYMQVLAFFAQQGMPLKERVPLLLVDSQSLGNAREREGERTHVEGGHTHDPISGPIIHTRGLCLWKVRVLRLPYEDRFDCKVHAINPAINSVGCADEPRLYAVNGSLLLLSARHDVQRAGLSACVACLRSELSSWLQEYRSIRTVVRARQGGSSFWSTRPELVNLQSSSCEITAILVLCGLPWLLTGSILAHEAMHAWLR